MVERIINQTLTTTRNFEHLFPFESRFMKINGHDLHYIDEGKGKTVIMVHGNPTWSFYFRHLIRTLSKDFRAIAMDHIGCGFSDKPDPDYYCYSLESRINDLDFIINTLCINEKITLVLHDWGGMIGLAWAVDHPDRIDKIIITNTSGFFLPGQKQLPFVLKMIKYVKIFAVPAVLGLNIFARGALYLCVTKKLSSDVKKGLIEPYNSWKNRVATLKFVQDIPISKTDQSYAIVDHVDRSLKQLDESNLLFLWGTKDFVFDRTFLNEFKTRFPRAVFHIFNDAGHYLFEDKPDETSRLIQTFLKK